MGFLMLVLVVLLSYLLGSIPTAFLLGKLLKGLDIRQHGSGNMGATNAFRVLGKGPGAFVLILDLLKGLIPVVFFAGWLSPGVAGKVAAALGAVCGHNWTCFLNFNGGKGVATSAGVLLGMMIVIPGMRWPVALCLFGWITCFLVTSYISLSSIIAAIFLPILLIGYSVSFPLVMLGIIFCILVVWRHRPNIKRLLAGQEPRVSFLFYKKSAIKRPNGS